MTTKKELKQHISELRELIHLRDAKITELRDQNAELIHETSPKFEQVCKEAAKVIRLGDFTVNSWEGDLPEETYMSFTDVVRDLDTHGGKATRKYYSDHYSHMYIHLNDDDDIPADIKIISKVGYEGKSMRLTLDDTTANDWYRVIE